MFENPSEHQEVGHRLAWLPRSEDVLFLNGWGQLRKAAGSTDTYEVECLMLVAPRESCFSTEDGSGPLLEPAFEALTPLPDSVWAPLEQLGLLARGTYFFEQQALGQAKPVDKAIHRFRCVRGVGTADLAIGEEGTARLSSRLPTQVAPWAREHRAPTYCLAREGEVEYPIACMEVLRFYVGALSATARNFMDILTKTHWHGVLDLEHTMEVSPGVLQVAPAPGLTDRGSALTAALLYFSDDILRMWERAALSISTALGNERAPYPVCILPESSKQLEVAGRRLRLLDAKGATSQTPSYVVDTIISAHRPKLCDRLLIRLPDGMTLDDFERDDQGDPARPRDVVLLPDGAPLDSSRRPKRGPRAKAAFHASVRHAFPSLGEIETEYVAEQKRTAQHKTWRRVRWAEVISTAPYGSDAEAVRAELHPQRQKPSTDEFAPPPGQAEFFDDEEFDPLLTRVVPRDRLPFPLDMAVAASGWFARAGRGSLMTYDAAADLDGQVRLFELPTTWGSSACMPRLERGRLAVVLLIDAGGFLVHAFELERRWKEKIGLGLVAARSGEALSLARIGAVLRHAISRPADRTDVSGGRNVWPTQERYGDLVGRMVPHRGRKLTSLDMVERLDDLASAMKAASLQSSEGDPARSPGASSGDTPPL